MHEIIKITANTAREIAMTNCWYISLPLNERLKAIEDLFWAMRHCAGSENKELSVEIYHMQEKIKNYAKS